MRINGSFECTRGPAFGRHAARRIAFGAVLVAAGLAPARHALADEPRTATEPHVMRESGNITNVIDAFDDDNGDPFDLNVSLGFQYLAKTARILRETNIAAPGLTTGRFVAHTLQVGNYSETTSILTPRIDIGIYKDFAAHVALPIILNDTQSIKAINGSGNAGSPALAGAPGEQLFGLPFQSPDRSGLEDIRFGLDVDIFNQARDITKPTWLFGLEGRFSVGPPMQPCNPNPPAGQVKCADPADVNRNGTSDNQFEGTGLKTRAPGVTRGTVGLDIHTILSKRIKYLEPYGGFDALFEFYNSPDFSLTNQEASLVNHPPLVGTMMIGTEIIPWENREKFARVTLDLRLEGSYHSEGRDYSELFDALGSSSAPSLRQPQWARYKANPNGNNPASIVDEGSQKTYFTGLADVASYGSARVSGSIAWQASELVKFQFGVGYKKDGGHFISDDQPCNPGLKGDITKSGPCHSDLGGGRISATGEPNPNYRATVNEVGRRFYVDNIGTFDLFASGVVMF